MNNEGLSSVVGAVMMVGLISICFSVIYMQVIPQMRSFADSLRPYPTVISTLDGGNLSLYMSQGLPVEGGWSLLVDGVQVANGSSFFVGSPICYTFTHNSTHDVALVENALNPRMLYFQRVTIGNTIPPEEPGLPVCLHYYAFEGNTRDSYRSYNLTNNGATFTSGHKGQGVYFNGDDFLYNITDCNLGRHGTISFWMKPTQNLNGQGVLGNISHYLLAYYTNPDKIFYLYNGEQASSLLLPDMLDQWHHVAVTFNESYVHFYLDGVDVTDSGSSGAQTYSFQYVGKAPSSLYYFYGYIDGLCVFSRDITQAEIQTVMEAT